MKWRIGLAVCLALAQAIPATAADKPADKPVKFEIPYRLTDTKHVLVRAKINGKGPFNLILDTGAPAVFITKPVAKKADVDVNDKGWGTFTTFEIEGGLKLEKVKIARGLLPWSEKGKPRIAWRGRAAKKTNHGSH